MNLDLYKEQVKAKQETLGRECYIKATFKIKSVSVIDLSIVDDICRAWVPHVFINKENLGGHTKFDIFIELDVRCRDHTLEFIKALVESGLELKDMKIDVIIPNFSYVDLYKILFTAYIKKIENDSYELDVLKTLSFINPTFISDNILKKVKDIYDNKSVGLSFPLELKDEPDKFASIPDFYDNLKRCFPDGDIIIQPLKEIRELKAKTHIEFNGYLIDIFKFKDEIRSLLSNNMFYIDFYQNFSNNPIKKSSFVKKLKASKEFSKDQNYNELADILKKFIWLNYEEIKIKDALFRMKRVGSPTELVFPGVDFSIYNELCSPLMEEGEWTNGIWENGEFGGRLFDGFWKNGIFSGGTFKGKIWEDGFFRGMIWEDGDWFDGEFLSGVWKRGNWFDGTWKAGTWKNGNIWSVKFVGFVESNISPKEFKFAEDNINDFEEFKKAVLVTQ